MSEIVKKDYPVIIERDEDGAFIVECPLFDGCRSYGHTIDEAMANIQEAIEACEASAGPEESSTTFAGVNRRLSEDLAGAQ